MAKPANLFRWATNGGTTLAPSSGRQDTGWAVGERPPARMINWLANGAYQWFQYLDNLHGETQFLNKAYTWTAAHVFGGALTANGALNANGAVTFGAGISPALGSVTEEIVYTAPRLRGVSMPLRSQTIVGIGTSSVTSKWVYDPADGILKSDVQTSAYECVIDVPSGCTLKAVQVKVKPRRTGGATGTMSMQLQRITLDVISGTGNTVANVPTGTGTPKLTTTTGTGNFDTLTMGVISEVVDNAGKELMLRVLSSDGVAGSPDEIHSIYCQFEETRATGGI